MDDPQCIWKRNYACVNCGKIPEPLEILEDLWVARPGHLAANCPKPAVSSKRKLKRNTEILKQIIFNRFIQTASQTKIRGVGFLFGRRTGCRGLC